VRRARLSKYGSAFHYARRRFHGFRRNGNRGFEHDSATPQPQSQDQEDGPACLQREKRKGKFCGEHLKRWFYAVDVLETGMRRVEKAGVRMPKSIAATFVRRSICPVPTIHAGMNVAGKVSFSVSGDDSSEGKKPK